MHIIKDMIDGIDDELCGAKDYAEKYLYEKAVDNPKFAKYYLDMANDEIRHAMHLHEIVVSEIEKLRKVYTPPQEMLDMWEKSHKEYVEKTAWIKQMLLL